MFFKKIGTIIKNRRLLIAALCLIFALFAVSGATLAWIMSNKNANDDNAELAIEGYNVAAIPFSAYLFDKDTKTGIEVFGEDIVLPLYDSVFKEQNSDCCLIYRAPVFGEAVTKGNPFTITLDLEDRSDETGLSDNNFRDSNVFEEGTTNPAIANYVSNAVYVRCGVIDSLQEDEIDADTVYTDAHAFFSAPGGYSEERFLIVSDTDTKNADITFTVSGYTPANVLYVYLEVGYDPILVEKLLESQGLSLSGDDLTGSTITIDSDLSEFTFASISIS